MLPTEIRQPKHRRLTKAVPIFLFAVIAQLTAAFGGLPVESELIGEWKTEAGLLRFAMTFTKNHKWTATFAGAKTGAARGTWKLHGDNLRTTYEIDTLKPNRIGTTDSDTVVTPDHTVLVVRSGKTKQLETLTRTK